MLRFEFGEADLEPLIEQVIERVLAKHRTTENVDNEHGDQLLYSEQQAAHKLGLTQIALKNERLKGRIECLKRGKQVKYLPEQLAAYVESWKHAAEQVDPRVR